MKVIWLLCGLHHHLISSFARIWHQCIQEQQGAVKACQQALPSLQCTSVQVGCHANHMLMEYFHRVIDAEISEALALNTTAAWEIFPSSATSRCYWLCENNISTCTVLSIWVFVIQSEPGQREWQPGRWTWLAFATWLHHSHTCTPTYCTANCVTMSQESR